MIKKRILTSREEWLEARSGRIGGSDASALVGLNPYKSNVDLWREKTGRITMPDISDKAVVRYGHDAEPHLRALFALDFPEYEVFYEDNNIWLNDRFPFAHASLDGWLRDKDGRAGILEIKTTEIMQSMQKEKWADRIPDNYYCQCLWYMAVLEADFCILKAQLKYRFRDGQTLLHTRHYHIEREDVRADIDMLLKAAERFYGFMRAGKEPPLILPEI